MYDALIELPIKEKERKEFEELYIFPLEILRNTWIDHAKFGGLDTHAARDKGACVGRTNCAEVQ